MTLTYYGHCAFLWTSEAGVRILIDPYGNSPESYWFLLPFPLVRSDITLVTHDHFDHNAVEGLPGNPLVIRDPGDFGRDDVAIRGVLDLHSGRSGLNGMHNTIYVIDTGGVRYCHIGDNRHDIPDDVRDQIGGVDVLMVTVDDSSHLLSNEQVDSLVDTISPKIVVPMHYFNEGITTLASTLKSPRNWLATQSNVKRLGNDTVSLTSDGLPAEREVWMFDPALT